MGLVAPVRVQVVLLKVPVEELEKVTVPPGAEEPVPAVSVTVAVQVLGWPAVTGDPQLTEVLVLRLFTVRANGEALLSLLSCTLLPA